MTNDELRDWFAGQALLTIQNIHQGYEGTSAAWCYTMADAMMEARKK